MTEKRNIVVPGSPETCITRSELLSTFRTLLADPVRLSSTIAATGDEASAAAALSREFGVDVGQATIFLDQSFRLLIGGFIDRQ